jgi:hypothetical protein
MTTSPVIAPAEQPLREFVDRVAWSTEHRAYPVLDGGRPVGLLVLPDASKAPRSDWLSLHVRDAMLPLTEVTVVREDDAALDALAASFAATRVWRSWSREASWRACSP